MSKNKKYWYLKGMRDAIPIGLGYFAVSLALGIAAVNAGMTAPEASLAAFLTNASAGGYIGFRLIGQNAAYMEMILMEAVANARYLLMSCALSQKFDKKTSLFHRMLVGFNVTDEVFGICISVDGKLNPFYVYGADCVTIPGWALGTLTGAILGSVLPVKIVSALSVALYGMFIAIFIPPAKKNRVVLGTVIIGALTSFIMSRIGIFSQIPEGMRIIIITVAVSLAAAVFFPVKEDSANEA